MSSTNQSNVAGSNNLGFLLEAHSPSIALLGLQKILEFKSNGWWSIRMEKPVQRGKIFWNNYENDKKNIILVTLYFRYHHYSFIFQEHLLNFFQNWSLQNVIVPVFLLLELFSPFVRVKASYFIQLSGTDDIGIGIFQSPKGSILSMQFFGVIFKTSLPAFIEASFPSA